MDDPRITCPNCHAEIALTESLAGPMLSDLRRRMQAEQAEALARQKAEIEAQAREAARSAEAARIATLEQRAAEQKAEADARLARMEAQARAQAEKLAEAQKAQAAALERERALADRERELELTLQKRLNAALPEALARARAEAEEAAALRLVEKDQQMETLKRQIEALKKKAEQGSQQLQGEAAEVHLEERLATAFPFDRLEPVGKGVSGADVLQRVIGPAGQVTGAILWESKRTQNWNAAWLAKLREDQRAAGAEIAVIASAARPEGVESFALIEGIWVCAPGHALALGLALRQTLIEVANARSAREGQETKTELVYAYLTGPKFRHRVEAIVERFTEMRADLDRERRAMTRLWAKREAQITGVIDATVGMYGDLQGIAGASLPEIEGLDLPLLDGPDED